MVIETCCNSKSLREGFYYMLKNPNRKNIFPVNYAFSQERYGEEVSPQNNIL